MQSAGWAEDMYHLQASCAAMKDQLAAARDRWDGLVALMGLATMAQVGGLKVLLSMWIHMGQYVQERVWVWVWVSSLMHKCGMQVL